MSTQQRLDLLRADVATVRLSRTPQDAVREATRMLSQGRSAKAVARALERFVLRAYEHATDPAKDCTAELPCGLCAVRDMERAA